MCLLDLSWINSILIFLRPAFLSLGRPSSSSSSSPPLSTASLSWMNALSPTGGRPSFLGSGRGRLFCPEEDVTGSGMLLWRTRKASRTKLSKERRFDARGLSEKKGGRNRASELFRLPAANEREREKEEAGGAEERGERKGRGTGTGTGEGGERTMGWRGRAFWNGKLFLVGRRRPSWAKKEQAIYISKQAISRITSPSTLLWRFPSVFILRLNLSCTKIIL